jgi:hypothetical protein
MRYDLGFQSCWLTPRETRGITPAAAELSGPPSQRLPSGAPWQWSDCLINCRVPNKSRLQDHALVWIQRLPSGRIFGPSELYRYLLSSFPADCRDRGSSATEPRYQNDARWGIKKAFALGIIRHVGTGSWQKC